MEDSQFNAEEFVGNPSIEELKAAKVNKDQLKYIAANFGIQFTHETRKDHLMTLILTHLGEQGTSSQSVTDTTQGPSAHILLEIEKVKMQTLQMKLEYESREKERERNHQLVLLQHNQIPTTQTPNKLQVTKLLPLLPQFSDYDPEAFFREFESSATHFQLPKEDWTWVLKPKLTGKARSVLDRVQDNTNYEVVKSAILTAYAVTTERCQ